MARREIGVTGVLKDLVFKLLRHIKYEITAGETHE
jgi:hypothetical protein